MKNISNKISESVNKNLGRLLREEASSDYSGEMNYLDRVGEQVEYDAENFLNQVKGTMSRAKRLLPYVYENFKNEFGDVIVRQINSGIESGEAYYIFETNVDGSNNAWNDEGSEAMELEEKVFQFYDPQKMPGVRIDTDTLSNGMIKLTLMIQVINPKYMSNIMVSFFNDSFEGLDLNDYDNE